MLKLHQIINKPYSSNTFVIENENSRDIWLIDAGFSEDLFKIIDPSKNVKGVLLTHAHYDHIQGLNEIINIFPSCIIYCSSYTMNGLYDSKANLSFYHDKPLTIKKCDVQLKSNNETIVLYDNVRALIYETPGHNHGSLCFLIEHFLFTGDSYIPQIPVVTKLKGGDRHVNANSLGLIFSIIKSETILCPGHGSIFEGDELKKVVFKDRSIHIT